MEKKTGSNGTGNQETDNREKKALINVKIPDIARIGSRTFWLGICAMLCVTGALVFLVFKYGTIIVDKDMLSIYFSTVKDILVIILVGKYVAGQEKKK